MNPYLAIYPIGHLPSNEKIQANLVLEKKLIHNGHYEMEKCLDPLPFTTTIPSQIPDPIITRSRPLPVRYHLQAY
jgi:hypothetical protein